MIEELEDILHKEKMKELQKEIDELPDYYTGNNIEYTVACYNLNSLDLTGGPPHLSQTAWKDKELMTEYEMNVYKSKIRDLKYLTYGYKVWGILSLLSCYILLWYISASY